jgi:hypothetical protein
VTAKRAVTAHFSIKLKKFSTQIETGGEEYSSLLVLGLCKLFDRIIIGGYTMSTHIRLADLTDKALNLLKAQGLSASTLGGYTKKYEFLKKYLYCRFGCEKITIG